MYHGFSEEKAGAVVDNEIDFLETRSFVKVNPLPDSYNLNSTPDNVFYSLCRFDKLSVRYIALVMKISQRIVDVTEPINNRTTRPHVKTIAWNDPAFMFDVCLARLANRNPGDTLGHIFQISNSALSAITENVVNHIFNHFSHLLNIESCCYNKSYLNLLAKKSIGQMAPGVQ